MSVSVEVHVPTMLAGLIGGSRRIAVEAENISAVIEALTVAHPQLRVHILDETAALRPHVTLFHNDRQVDDWSTEVRAGDTITVLQAVSGG